MEQCESLNEKLFPPSAEGPTNCPFPKKSEEPFLSPFLGDPVKAPVGVRPGVSLDAFLVLSIVAISSERSFKESFFPRIEKQER